MNIDKNNNQYRCTLQFNREKEKQRFAVHCLQGKGRKKAAYIAEAIWMYEKYIQTGQYFDVENEMDDTNIPDVSLSDTVDTSKTQLNPPILEDTDDIVEGKGISTDIEITDDAIVVIESEKDVSTEDNISHESEPVELEIPFSEDESLNQDQIKNNLKVWGLNY